MTHHLQSVINGLYKACQDDEPFVVDQVLNHFLAFVLSLHSTHTSFSSLSNVPR